VFWFAEASAPWWTWRSAFSLSNSTFHDFKLCCGYTWILFKSIFYRKP
jgi:hypothetical protein